MGEITAGINVKTLSKKTSRLSYGPTETHVIVFVFDDDDDAGEIHSRKGRILGEKTSSPVYIYWAIFFKKNQANKQTTFIY